MTRTEDDLRDLYRRPAVGDDVTQRVVSRTPTIAQRAVGGRVSGPVLWAAVAAVVVGMVVAITVVRSKVQRDPAAAPVTHAGTSLPSTHASSGVRGAVPRGDGATLLARVGGVLDGFSIQLRDLADGHLVSTIYRGAPGTELSASRDSSGSIFIATSSGCQSVVRRLDPGGSGAPVVSRVPESMAAISVAPNGDRLSYLTYPTCVVPPPCSGVCHGLELFLPNVLAVLDLQSGSVVRTATDTPGHPFFGSAWSPNGRQIVAGYTDERLLVMDADHPDFQHAARIPSPAGCAYFAPTWSVSGIVAAEDCRSEPGLSPSRLVRLDSAGRVTATWPLPKCINGLGLMSDPADDHVVVQADIGYGNGPCGRDWRTQLLIPVGDHLRVLFDRARGSGSGGSLELLGR